MQGCEAIVLFYTLAIFLSMVAEDYISRIGREHLLRPLYERGELIRCLQQRLLCYMQIRWQVVGCVNVKRRRGGGFFLK